MSVSSIGESYFEPSESDRDFEAMFDEIFLIHEERKKAENFPWKECMYASLEALYHPEWPALLSWIPLFQALIQTVQAYLAYRNADWIDQKAYLERVETLANQIFTAKGIQGTDKERLARYKVRQLHLRLKKRVWENQALIQAELKYLLEEIYDDFSHHESYSTLQLLFQDTQDKNAILEKLPKSSIWHQLCDKILTGNPETFQKEVKQILKKGDSKTRISAKKIDRIFAQSLAQLSPFQPISQSELALFKRVLRDSLIPCLQTDTAKRALDENLATLFFSDFSSATEAVTSMRLKLLGNLKEEIAYALPQEFLFKLNERKALFIDPKGYKRTLVDDIDVLLPTLPQKHHKRFMEVMRHALNLETDHRQEILNHLPWLLEENLKRDLEKVEIYLSDPVVSRKILHFIRERVLPEQEAHSFFLTPKKALKRLEPVQNYPEFSGLISWINASKKVDRVLFDYFIEKIIEEANLSKDLEKQLMFFSPELSFVIQTTVQSIVE